MDTPSDSQLIEAFDEIKGTANKFKAFADFNGFYAAVNKYKPECLSQYRDDYLKVALQMFTDICETGK